MTSRAKVVLVMGLLILPLASCRWSDHSPNGGMVTAVQARTNQIRVRGVAVDPDRPASPVTVRISVGGVTRATTQTSREVVPNGSPMLAGQPAFVATVPARPGRNRVCAVAVNLGPLGSTRSLGCRTVVANGDPIGFLDVVSSDAPGQINLAGWAYDPDPPGRSGPFPAVSVRLDGLSTGAPIPVGWKSPGPAVFTDLEPYVARPRPDVSDVYGPGRDETGFEDRLDNVTGGRHQVCVVAPNYGPGVDRLLGCRSVTVAAAPPTTVAPG